MQIGRLKTGTPPRLDGSTINYDDLEMQPADDDITTFLSLQTKVVTNKSNVAGFIQTMKSIKL